MHIVLFILSIIGILALGIVAWFADKKRNEKKGKMKVMRCMKLGGRKVPQSCHVLNGRKDSCNSLFDTDEKEEILKFE